MTQTTNPVGDCICLAYNPPGNPPAVIICSEAVIWGRQRLRLEQ